MEKKIFFSIVLFKMLAASAMAQEKRRIPESPPAIAAMQKKYQEVRSLIADFEQTQILAIDAQTKNPQKASVSNGNISIARDPKRGTLRFRWQTLAPNPAIAVSNGKKFWLYTPPFREGENGQVQIHKAETTALLADLLLTNRPLQKSFDLKPLACDPQRACIELHPKKPSGDLDRAELHIEKRTNLVYQVVLINMLGNRTELKLKNIQLNPQLQPSVFEFKVPPKTEVIQ